MSHPSNLHIASPLGWNVVRLIDGYSPNHTISIRQESSNLIEGTQHKRHTSQKIDGKVQSCVITCMHVLNVSSIIFLR
jgi:hypothetical protein